MLSKRSFFPQPLSCTYVAGAGVLPHCGAAVSAYSAACALLVWAGDRGYSGQGQSNSYPRLRFRPSPCSPTLSFRRGRNRLSQEQGPWRLRTDPCRQPHPSESAPCLAGTLQAHHGPPGAISRSRKSPVTQLCMGPPSEFDLCPGLELTLQPI